MQKKVYLLLLSQHLGGAEIRFLRIFRELNKLSDTVRLIFCEGYLEKVTTFKEFEGFSAFESQIVVIKPYKSYEDKSFNFIYEDLIKLIPENSVIHFNQNFPASLFKVISHKTIYTYNENSISRFSFKDRLFFYLIMLRSNTIDILDPVIYKRLKKMFFFRRNIKLTQAGSLDTKDYNFHFGLKENSIIFSGRFNEQKQVMKFVDSIKTIDFTLSKRGISNLKYYLLGDGPLQLEVESSLLKLSKEGIFVYSGFKKNYKGLLEKSKVFLSIQKFNNYPSNSLMEAMACGAIPITINNGSTKLLAKESFSYYVPENFTSEELAKAVEVVLTLDDSEARKRSIESRKVIENQYNIQNAAKYYFNLYKELDK